MLIYALTAFGPVGRSYRATWAYREMFHGSSKPDPAVNRYRERPYKPLRLIHHARLTPPVFFPSIRLVVEDRIAHDLARFDGVDLSPCKWHRVWDYPTDEPSVWDLVENRFPGIFDNGFSDWLEKQLRPPTAQVQRLRYFEVIAPFFDRVRQPFTCDRPLDLPNTLEDVQTATCAKLHALYPVVYLPPFYLLTETAFRVIQPHVADPDLFGVREINLAAD